MACRQLAIGRHENAVPACIVGELMMVQQRDFVECPNVSFLGVWIYLQ